MKIQLIQHIGPDLSVSKEVIERLIEENMRTKLDNYLKKFSKEDAEGKIDIKIDKNKKWLFDASIQAKLDGKAFRFEREDYKNLDDLLNHLFDHFKQALSDL